jgi:uncharacterized protein (DUF4415 family)
MNMKRTEKDTEVTSERAQTHGLRRIPRRHQTKPGEVTLSDCKVRVTMYVDGDVLEYFKRRAAQSHAAPYQTQINNELRAIMERDQGDPFSSLVNDERFISAVAERLQKRRKRA